MLCFPLPLLTRAMKHLEVRRDSVVCLHEGARGRGRRRALEPAPPSWPDIWVQQKNRHFMMSTTAGIWACAINTNAPRPAPISKVCGFGGAPCFSKRPWNVPPCPGAFLGPQRPFGVRTAQREVLAEEVIPFRWKIMHCFMGDRNLGQVSWVNPSASSCSLSLFAALRYLTSADDFSCVKSCWMLYAARAASELLPRRGWV